MHPEFSDTRAFEARLAMRPASSVYGQVTGRPEWGSNMARLLPAYMHGAVTRYVATGHISPGSFLCAVLSNDLMEAFSRADVTNLYAMPDWVMFIYNYMPSGCYGSAEAVAAWSGMISESAE